MDSRTPVVVGIGTVLDHAGEADALELMWTALTGAATDSGGAGILGRVDVYMVPKGTWSSADPGRVLAARAGGEARTVLAELGVLQQALFDRAATAIVEGRADIVAIVGGEAKQRGTGPRAPAGEGLPPDEVWRPENEIISRLEIERGLGVPARQYAMIDNALRWATGETVEQQAATLAELWAAMNRVAVDNPDAWDRRARTATDIVTAGPGNRVIAAPYTKSLCSQWNVHQAAALLLCAAEVADALGVPRDRWVFPVAAAESNAMVPLSRRADLASCPAFELAGRRALELAGVTIDAIEFIDLYSCFPAAVRVQQRELGLGAERAMTVTGGMTFAGGPFNNYVLQSTAKMASILREHPSATGLVTTVSGMLTKQAAAVWSPRPPATPFRWDDVSSAAAKATPQCEVVGDVAGDGVVASYTVAPGPETSLAIALVDLADGRRTIATTDEPESITLLVDGEWCGRNVAVDTGQLRLDG
jgi:acetyl-CoA C-acetyltransferase